MLEILSATLAWIRDLRKMNRRAKNGSGKGPRHHGAAPCRCFLTVSGAAGTGGVLSGILRL